MCVFFAGVALARVTYALKRARVHASLSSLRTVHRESRSLHGGGEGAGREGAP